MAELLDTARVLVRSAPRRPRLPDLRRAVSTARYAFFHAIAEDAADRLARGAARSRLPWPHVDRAREHRRLRDLEAIAREPVLPAPVLRVATVVRQLQERERADHDPTGRCLREEVLEPVERAELAIRARLGLPGDVRRALVLGLLFERGPGARVPFAAATRRIR